MPTNSLLSSFVGLFNSYRKQNSGHDQYLRPPSELRSQCYGHSIFDLTQTPGDLKQTPTQTLPPPQQTR